MSRHNLAYALPADERPAAYQVGAADETLAAAAPEEGGAPVRADPQAPPADPLTGATLESAAIGEALEAALAAHADMKAARSAQDCHRAAARLRDALNKPDIAALSRHLAKTAGAACR